MVIIFLEEEERRGARRKHEFVNRIAALLAADRNRSSEETASIHNKLDSLNVRMSTIDNKLDSLFAFLQEDRDRSAAEFATIRNIIKAEFSALHNRIDALGVGHREIIDDIQTRCSDIMQRLSQMSPRLHGVISLSLLHHSKLP